MANNEALTLGWYWIHGAEKKKWLAAKFNLRYLLDTKLDCIANRYEPNKSLLRL